MHRNLLELEFQPGQDVRLDISGVQYCATLDKFLEKVMIFCNVRIDNNVVLASLKVAYDDIGKRCSISQMNRESSKEMKAPANTAPTQQSPENKINYSKSKENDEGMEQLITDDWEGCQPDSSAIPAERGFFDDFARKGGKKSYNSFKQQK